MSDLKPQVKNRYANHIASICNQAIANIIGLSTEANLMKPVLGLKSLKNKNIHVYFDQDEVTIDAYVTVDFETSIPEAVCKLQEIVKKQIEEETHFKIAQINVHVTNLNL